ncbi:pentatricopeptide repeat-containing protein At5g61370, mitochondrial [Malania oleifera]|uniref:pentatricopeptide repeat-containing protein At5g61370, mitochondrial n=1 Tax=Malania oleifera TaxID=397392 RepID=UPI0025ADE4D0|nr:pentatricopeptide repeat-containing protein At5g61370, mitochondrial [Malania oleifera]
MLCLLKPKWQTQAVNTQISRHVSVTLYSTAAPTPISSKLQEICNVVSSSIGSLDDLEVSLNRFAIPLTSPLVTQITCSCKGEAPTRRLLRFFLWSCKNLNSKLEDVDFNHVIRVFAEKKDFTAMDVLISDLGKESRTMESRTFSIVAEALVKLGKEDQALGIFKKLDKFKCPHDTTTVVAIVNALCMRGHARRAEGVLSHHNDKVSGAEACIYRNLLYGWSVQKNVKEARRILQQMKSIGVNPDLFCYNMFLKCLCERNVKFNPSGLVPETLNVMMEMRTNGITPTSISYNILLSCLGRTRRVKESNRILISMKNSGCSRDWFSYYLVVRVLFLSKRFGKGRQIIEEMIAEGLTPEPKFYYDLIGVLCGVERVNYALDLFEQMKKSSFGHYGPVYDLLIPKLCRSGDFEKGRELWDEAVRMGVTLSCSRDLLDPSITEVFKPTRKIEDLSLVECTTSKYQERVMKMRMEKKIKKNKKYKKNKRKKK